MHPCAEPGFDAERRSQRIALAAALALVAIWGANFSVQKLIFPVLGPDGFLFGRYLIMPLLAACWMVQRYGADWPPVELADRWRLLRLAVAGHVLHVGLVTWGIHLSTAFSSAVMLACGPLFTLLLLRLTGTDRLTGAQVAGVVVALAGVVVFLSEKLAGAGWRTGWGDLVLLVAASFFSYYTVSARDLIQRIGGMPVMAYTTLIASPLLVGLSWTGGARVDWAALGWAGWLALFWSVVISSFLGWLLWGWVNAVRGVARTAPLLYLMPVVAGVIAWWVLGERFTVVNAGGAALTLAGVALAQARFARSGGAGAAGRFPSRRLRPRRWRLAPMFTFLGANGPLVPARAQAPDNDD
ncbi:MAG: DMT family transporter [Burkholderiaceae bacterium]